MASTHIWHGRNQSSHHDRMEITLISDQVGTHTSITSEWPCAHIWSCKTISYNRIRKALNPKLSIPGTSPGSSIPRMATTLISDLVGTNPSITSEWPCAHIWSCKTTSYIYLRKALSPRPSIPGNSPGSSIPRMAVALISDHVGTNPIVVSEWLSTHIWHGRNQSSPWQNGSALTSNHGRTQSSHHVRMALGLIISLWRKPRSGEHQASPWSTRTSP